MAGGGGARNPFRLFLLPSTFQEDHLIAPNQIWRSLYCNMDVLLATVGKTSPTPKFPLDKKIKLPSVEKQACLLPHLAAVSISTNPSLPYIPQSLTLQTQNPIPSCAAHLAAL